VPICLKNIAFFNVITKTLRTPFLSLFVIVKGLKLICYIEGFDPNLNPNGYFGSSHPKKFQIVVVQPNFLAVFWIRIRIRIRIGIGSGSRRAKMARNIENILLISYFELLF
jgi:hypothetical protein